jgi:hypothetical protein
VATLRVVGRCGCGCPSVDFEADGQRPPAYPIAEGTGTTADGREVEIMLWGRADAITGLEICESGPKASGRLPTLESLRSWDEQPGM